MNMTRFVAAARSFAVTPRSGLPMSGFLSREKPARGRRDELEVNMLWVATPGTDGVLWVSIDVLAITPRLRAAVVEATAADGFDPDRVVVVASHTHSGPSTWHEQIHPVFPEQFDLDELRLLADRIRAHTAGLRASIRPAVVTWRSGEVHGVGGNRHRPDGPHDPSLGLLEVVDASSGERVALLFDYACHPTVLGPENTLWSADWIFGARNRVRSSPHGGGDRLPVVFLQGCAGDASSRFFRLAQGVDEALRLGGIVGDRILDLLDRAGDVLLPGAIRVDRASRSFPVRSDFSAPGADRDRSGRLAASLAEGARCLAALGQAVLPPVIALPLAVVTLGSRRWLHLPVEMCASYGLEIAAGHDGVRVIGYTDDYHGYIADRESFRTGQYEAMSSYFDEDTSHRVMVESLAYLDSVYETSRS